MNKHIKTYIFSIVACLMINAGLFAGGPYTRVEIEIMLTEGQVSQDRKNMILQWINEVLNKNFGTSNEGKITKKQLDTIMYRVPYDLSLEVGKVLTVMAICLKNFNNNNIKIFYFFKKCSI